MRRAAFALLALFVLTGAAPKEKPGPFRDVSGIEWLQMSVGARTDHVVAAMLKLAEEGVPLAYAPDEYYRAVHEKVRRNPSLYGASVSSIVAMHAYDREPEARPAIDSLRARRAGAAS